MVTVAPRGAASGRATSGRGRATGRKPFLSALPRKMSAKEGPITARKPWSRSAHTACSRDEPQPKLRPTTSTGAPAASGRLSGNSGRGDAVRVVAPVGEEALAQARARGALQETRGDDLVGVDVVQGKDDGAAGEDAEGLHRYLISSRASVTRPVTAAAAAVRGLASRVRPARALAAFEVPVAGAHRVAAGLEAVAVHGDAHRAAGLAPLRARVAEHAVEAFRLRLLLHLLGAGDDQRAHAVGHVAAGAARSRPRAGRRGGRWCSSR